MTVGIDETELFKFLESIQKTGINLVPPRDKLASKSSISDSNLYSNHLLSYNSEMSPEATSPMRMSITGMDGSGKGSAYRAFVDRVPADLTVVRISRFCSVIVKYPIL